MPVLREASHLKRAVIIHNGASGRARNHEKLRPAIGQLQAGGLQVDVVETHCEADVQSGIAFAQHVDAAMIISAGGDGSLNDVCNAAINATIPIGVLPFGTANVFAQEIGLKSTEHAISTLLLGQTRLLQLGRANRRYFVLMAGIGFDADVLQRVDRSLKRHIGRASFIIPFLKAAYHYGKKRFYLSINGNKPLFGSSVVALNGAHYAGAYRLAPHGSLSQKTLQICILNGSGTIDTFRLGLSLISEKIDRCQLISFQEAYKITINGGDETPIQLDGDVRFYGPVQIEGGAAEMPFITPQTYI